MAKKPGKTKQKATKTPRVVKEVMIPRAKAGCKVLLGPNKALVLKSDEQVTIPRALARVIPTARLGCDV